jgi:PKHD-type hydroxylase
MPYCYWDGAFTESELVDIEKYCENFEKFDGEESTAEGFTKIRKSKVKFFNKSDSPELNSLFDKFNYLIWSINDDYYNFELNGYDSIQYTQYNGDDSGEYGYHIDMMTGDSIKKNEFLSGDTRKLSVVLFLSEPQSYEGGKFTMKISEKETEIEQIRGRIIFFPSFFLHKVHPLTN